MAIENIYQVRDIYAYADGDCILPAMGVSIDSGYSLTQYWDPEQKKVINTDFTVHNAKLFPQAYSTNAVDIIVPDSAAWYIDSTTGQPLQFDGSGNCITTGYSGIFKKSTIVANGKAQPCLVICGNLAKESSLTNKMIYFVGTYDGRSFVCQQEISVVMATSNSYDVIVSCEGDNKVSGDNIITNENDFVKFTPYLLRGGVTVTGATFTWEQLKEGTWQTINNTSQLTEIDSNGCLKVYAAAVYGVEYFRVTAKLSGTSADVKKVVSVSDTHDPYYLLDGCSTAGEVKNGETAVFSPQVFERTTNQPDTFHDWKFQFTVTDSTTGDVLLTANTTLSLSYQQIRGYGGKIRVQTRAYY